jgi:hypothetical protein
MNKREHIQKKMNEDYAYSFSLVCVMTGEKEEKKNKLRLMELGRREGREMRKKDIEVDVMD